MNNLGCHSEILKQKKAYKEGMLHAAFCTTFRFEIQNFSGQTSFSKRAFPKTWGATGDPVLRISLHFFF